MCFLHRYKNNQASAIFGYHVYVRYLQQKEAFPLVIESKCVAFSGDVFPHNVRRPVVRSEVLDTA